MSEEERVREILEEAARGHSLGNKLVYDKDSKSLRPSSYYDDPDSTMKLTNQDTHLFAK